MATSRANVRWLLKQLPGWEESKWISPEGAEKIRESYAAELHPATFQKRVLTLMSVLGAALIGGGVILMFAYNWDSFSRGLRMCLSFTPLAAAHVVAMFALIRKDGSAPWREGSSVAVMGAVAACIALISQTYNIQGSLENFMLIWILLSIPTVIVLKAPNSAFLLFGQLLFWSMVTRDTGEHSYEAWLLVIPIVATVLWLQYHEKKEHPLLNVTALVALCSSTVSSLDSWMSHSWMLVIVPFLVIGSAMGVHIPGSKTGPLAKGLSQAALLILLLGATYDNFWTLSHYGRDWGKSGLLVDLALILLVNSVATICLIRNGKSSSWVQRFVLSAHLLTFLGWYFAFIFPTNGSAAGIMNAIAVTFALVLIFSARKTGRTGSIQLGAGILCLLLLMRFFDFDFSLLVRGITFILTGSIFLGINLWLSRNFKGVKS